MSEKITFRAQMKNRLFEMMDSGVTKFISYDIFGKSTTRNQLNKIQGALSDLCQSLEIAQITDSHGKPKKITPRPDIIPEWIQSKVYITQYKFNNLGKPDTTVLKENYKKYKKNAEVKKESVVMVKTAWEDVWPDMYRIPKFKGKQTVRSNHCEG